MVQSIFLLLKYVLDCVVLTVSLLTAPTCGRVARQAGPSKWGAGHPVTLCLDVELTSQLPSDSCSQHSLNIWTGRHGAGDKAHTLSS